MHSAKKIIPQKAILENPELNLFGSLVVFQAEAYQLLSLLPVSKLQVLPLNLSHRFNHLPVAVNSVLSR